MSANNLKEAFAVEAKHSAFYTGGKICWSPDGDHLLCQNGGSISVLLISKGLVICRLGETQEDQEEDTVNSFTISPDNIHAVSHHKSSLFKLWTWQDGKLVKVWKSIHIGPVAQIVLQGDGEIMVSGGSDGGVRLWNLSHQACTHSFKGITGVVSVLAFHPDPQKELIFAAGDNAHILAWNIKNGQIKLKLTGHFSKITSLAFHDDGVHLVSAGRDKVLILWDLEKGTSIRVLPVYESLEGVFLVPRDGTLPVELSTKKSDDIYAAAAGEKGIVKIWEMRSGREIFSQKSSIVPAAKEEGGLSVTQLIFNSALRNFAVITVDHNIILHSLDTFACTNQLVGYSDEILDVAYLGASDSHLAVATNSADIKLYELTKMSCQLLTGHTDLVLALATSPANRNLLVSSAKDNSVRIWLMNPETMEVSCIGCGVRHTASVGSVAISQVTGRFFASVSQDSCLKVWSLPEKILPTDRDIALNAEHTVVAHQKDINSVAVSPNDRLIASGSQDKTAKLWNSENLQLLGVFRGHRRGVWCVRFSPIDQVLLTTSADCTIKLWSLTELNCLKTLEGHESSVLRAEFLSRGMQIITTGGDGLLKLWSVKTSECITTLEEHESRAWALAVNKNESHVISGGSDSLLVVWRDVTEENRLKATAEREKLILEEQKLSNLLKANELTDALRLALKLERPYQVIKIVDAIIKQGKNQLVDAIRELKPNRKEALLRCAVTWNTNSRNSHAAQLVINALLNEIGSDNLQNSGLASSIEAMIPYTERHFKRLTRLMQDLHLLNYTVSRIKPHNERPLIDNSTNI
ncbi:transducin beta-like protein 3 [Venturia canescens]|uniref:transducin beta-like protein 3 n=1 Tax=Venturia canescens TaxID=32260 RepID=UPI001C9D2A36|nr:transducin beta-like protein 3 [Venturia canescens]